MNLRRIYPGTLMFLLVFFVGVPSTMASPQESAIRIRTTVNESWDDRDVGVPDDLTYGGRPLSYWLNIIRERDEKMISLAFEAIRSLGPRAAAAVPELTRTVSAPFTPIHIDKDSDEVIADKLYDIEVRSAAIDALASIGEPASPATVTLIRWALTVRVMPGYTGIGDLERFIDLVTLDAEYRIRVIDAVTAFGKPAVPTVVRLLKSPDAEQRKLAVLMLGDEAFAIARDMLKSRNCDDKQLGIAILSDMKPIVATAYIADLNRSLLCDAN
jgi:HEAT repeat protein